MVYCLIKLLAKSALAVFIIIIIIIIIIIAGRLDPKLCFFLFLGLCSHSHGGISPPSHRDPSNNKVRAVKQRSIAWAGHVSRIGDRRSAYRIFVGKHGGWRSHGRPSCMWEDNIKMYVIRIGCHSVELGSSGPG